MFLTTSPQSPSSATSTTSPQPSTASSASLCAINLVLCHIFPGTLFLSAALPLIPQGSLSMKMLKLRLLRSNGVLLLLLIHRFAYRIPTAATVPCPETTNPMHLSPEHSHLWSKLQLTGLEPLSTLHAILNAPIRLSSHHSNIRPLHLLMTQTCTYRLIDVT